MVSNVSPDEAPAAWPQRNESAARRARRDRHHYLVGYLAGRAAGLKEAADMMARDEIDASIRLDPKKHASLSDWFRDQRVGAIRARISEIEGENRNG